MSRTLFLHIGLHKTGTTSIQRTLNTNPDALAAQGFGYVIGESEAQSFHGYLTQPNFADDPDTVVRLLDAGKMLSVLTAPPQDKVIASSEGFAYLFEGSAIQEIADVLKPAFDTIRIICYIRRQDQMAVSHHQQGARPRWMPAAGLYGNSPTALPQMNPRVMKYLDYERRLGFWADAFGGDAMIIRVFGRDTLTDGDSVADFMAQIGMARDEMTWKRESNTSRGAVKTKLGHILNEIVSAEATRMAIFNAIPDEGKLLPSRQQAIDFLAPFQDSNRRLNQRFKINDNPDLFDQDFSAYPEVTADQWTEPMADQAIRAMASAIQDLAAGTVELSVEDMRTAAIALETSHPALAKRLLRAALRAKPDGDGLRRHLRKIKHAIEATGGEGAGDGAEDGTSESGPSLKAIRKAAKAKSGKSPGKANRTGKSAAKRAAAGKAMRASA